MQFTSHHLAISLFRKPVKPLYFNVYLNSVCQRLCNWAVIEVKICMNIDQNVHTLMRGISKSLGIDRDEKYSVCWWPFCILNKQYFLAYIFSNCSYNQYFRSNTNSFFKAISYRRNLRREPMWECWAWRRRSLWLWLVHVQKGSMLETNCRLAPEAVCDFGLCSKKCTIAPAGTLSRKEENKCDLQSGAMGNSMSTLRIFMCRVKSHQGWWVLLWKEIQQLKNSAEAFLETSLKVHV